MSLEGKDETEIAELETQLVSKLRSLGGFAGNVSLQRALGWSDGLYWPVRNRVYDRGLVTLGRGRGGSVTLVEKEASGAEPAKPEATPAKPAEADLYGPIAVVLKRDWVKDYRLRQALVETTAAQGRRQTGGTWTRPDLVVVGVRVFPYLPNKFFDLFTFEAKPSWSIDVVAVYEALAHRRAATHAFVFLHVPTEKVEALRASIDAVASEAKRHGVGVISASDPGDYESWDVLVEAERVEPDPEALNDFIAVQLSPSAKEEIATWVR